MVSQLQTRLKELGFGPDTADGDFGPATKAAVIAFQKKSGLGADGIAGTRTLAALELNLTDDSSSSGNGNGPDLVSKLLVDYYHGDKAPDLGAVSGDERYAGVILKATEGLYYNGGDWFPQHCF
jgi:peptidoglycan hydrolase-like protein with peptidoglycan-binding domain